MNGVMNAVHVRYRHRVYAVDLLGEPGLSAYARPSLAPATMPPGSAMCLTRLASSGCD